MIRGAGSSSVGATGEGAAVGAGTMAGYEALQKGRGRGVEGDDDAAPADQSAGLGGGSGQGYPDQGSGQQQEDSWWVLGVKRN